MRNRFTLLYGLLAMSGACSGGSAPPGDSSGLDAEVDGAVASDDGTDSGEPSGDASAIVESGLGSTRDAGTAQARDATTEVRDAGMVRVYCNQAALGVCQTATVSTDEASSYRTQCTSQGGTLTACGAAGLVGCCVGDTSHYCYYSLDYTTSTAQQSCATMNGTWSTSM